MRRRQRATAQTVPSPRTLERRYGTSRGQKMARAGERGTRSTTRYDDRSLFLPCRSSSACTNLSSLLSTLLVLVTWSRLFIVRRFRFPWFIRSQALQQCIQSLKQFLVSGLSAIGCNGLLRSTSHLMHRLAHVGITSRQRRNGSFGSRACTCTSRRFLLSCRLIRSRPASALLTAMASRIQTFPQVSSHRSSLWDPRASNPSASLELNKSSKQHFTVKRSLLGSGFTTVCLLCRRGTPRAISRTET